VEEVGEIKKKGGSEGKTGKRKRRRE